MDKKLSSWQLILVSTGGMLGCGWLFSPYYGYQFASTDVLLAWLITAICMLIISLPLMKICLKFPIQGGLYELLAINHEENFTKLFLYIGWLSYLVYLPLEAQSIIQYLGYWFPTLVAANGDIRLSALGVVAAGVIILTISFFNMLVVEHVIRMNTLITFWKLLLPISISVVILYQHGSTHHFAEHYTTQNHDPRLIYQAITLGGLAFAFTGFHNSLFLVKHAKNPKRVIIFSLITPIIIGYLLYSILSLNYLFILKDGELLPAKHHIAPMLSLLEKINLPILTALLFFDAILAPLGTINVYTQITGTILHTIANQSPHKFFKKITQRNRYNAPCFAILANGIISLLFLLPLPSWSILVNFLSSLVVLSYLIGPLSNSHHINSYYEKFINQIAFCCCTLLLYLSGNENLTDLLILLILYCIYSTYKKELFLFESNTGKLTLMILALDLIALIQSKDFICEPFDLLFIFLSSLFFYKKITQ